MQPSPPLTVCLLGCRSEAGHAREEEQASDHIGQGVDREGPGGAGGLHEHWEKGGSTLRREGGRAQQDDGRNRQEGVQLVRAEGGALTLELLHLMLDGIARCREAGR